MIKSILKKTRELKRLLADKPNNDPIDIMYRVKRAFGEEWIASDVPSYFRNSLKKYKYNPNLTDFNN